MHPAADLSTDVSDSSKACSQVRSGRPVSDMSMSIEMIMIEMMSMIELIVIEIIMI